MNVSFMLFTTAEGSELSIISLHSQDLGCRDYLSEKSTWICLTYSRRRRSAIRFASRISNRVCPAAKGHQMRCDFEQEFCGIQSEKRKQSFHHSNLHFLFTSRILILMLSMRFYILLPFIIIFHSFDNLFCFVRKRGEIRIRNNCEVSKTATKEKTKE